MLRLTQELGWISDNDDAFGAKGLENKGVREDHILGDENPSFFRTNGIYHGVALTGETLDVNRLRIMSGIRKKDRQTNVHAFIELEFHPELVSLKGHSGRESTQLRMQERPGCLPF